MKPSLLFSKWRFLYFGLAVFFGVAAARATDGFSNGPVLCPFRLVTGYPCPFCGTTRAVGSLLLGDVSASLALNPLGLVFVVVVAALAVSPVVTIGLFESIKRRLHTWPLHQQVTLVAALAAVGWLRTLSQ